MRIVSTYPATGSPEKAAPPTAPKQGQLVRLRNRFFLVWDVFPQEGDRGEVSTRLDSECLDDDRLGEWLSVLWEREVHPEVLQADHFPPLSGKWDSPRVFHKSLESHLEHVSRPTAAAAPDRELVERFIQRSREEVEDDVLKLSTRIGASQHPGWVGGVAGRLR